MSVIKVNAFICERCGHIWLPKKLNSEKLANLEKYAPTACPKCHSPYWQTKKKGAIIDK
jgi:DNA-directed RNA polymerase subunit RPC12/RpoP